MFSLLPTKIFQFCLDKILFLEEKADVLGDIPL